MSTAVDNEVDETSVIDLLDLQIELREVYRLLPYARNSRTHSPEQIAQIAASIKEFGWRAPILVDTHGVIIAGHARLLAARQLEMAEVPVIVLSHLTPAQLRALVIAEERLAFTPNQRVRVSGSDYELLHQLLGGKGVSSEVTDEVIARTEQTVVDLLAIPAIRMMVYQLALVLAKRITLTHAEAIRAMNGDLG
jgi:ParB-like chromosome segregation protein Spo0J